MRRAVIGTSVVAIAACSHVAPPAPAAVPHAAPPPVAVAPAPALPAACADPAGDMLIPDDATTIDPAGVSRAIGGPRGGVRRCYQRYLKRDAHAGRVMAVLAVRDDGTVAQVQLRGFAAELDRCLCSVVAKVQFPAPHGTAIVAYPMQFTGTM